MAVTHIVHSSEWSAGALQTYVVGRRDLGKLGKRGRRKRYPSGNGRINADHVKTSPTVPEARRHTGRNCLASEFNPTDFGELFYNVLGISKEPFASSVDHQPPFYYTRTLSNLATGPLDRQGSDVTVVGVRNEK